MLSNCPGLEEIDMTDAFLGNLIDYLLISSTVQYRLQKLGLRRCHGLSDETIGAIGSVCPLLETLSLHGQCRRPCPITGHRIGAFIGSCKNIRRLDLSGCDQIKDLGLDGEDQVWRCYKHH